MKYLITNSDDFGLTKSITDAIIETHVGGIMTSTTMMPNMDGFQYGVEKAKEYSDLGVGIHFTLTEGKPLTHIDKIPDLVNEAGEFKTNKAQRSNFIIGKSIQRQIEIELTAQLERFLDHGIVPTHFDSHHHITGTPLAFAASLNVAKKFKVKRARVTSIDYLYASDFRGNVFSRFGNKIINLPKSMIHASNKQRLIKNGFKTPDTKILPSRVLPFDKDPEEQFIRTLSTLKEGVTEISFHPGYVNSYSNDSKGTAELRLRDTKVATSKAVMDYIKRNNIQLISFKGI